MRKALNLFSASNFSIFEWLGSPIVYRKDSPFFDELCALKDDFFNPKKIFLSHLSLAENNIKKNFDWNEVRIKKLLYVLRSFLVCKFILKYGTPPSTLFSDIYKDDAICGCTRRKELERLVALKKISKESDTVKISGEIMTFIEESQSKLSAKSEELADKIPLPISKLNSFFLKEVLKTRNYIARK